MAAQATKSVNARPACSDAESPGLHHGRARTRIASPPSNSGVPSVVDSPHSSQARTSPASGAGERLESWKEIAAYLKRGIKTVQRWEKHEALPVHRHIHDKLGSVYAYTSELDAWRNGRTSLIQEHDDSLPDSGQLVANGNENEARYETSDDAPVLGSAGLAISSRHWLTGRNAGAAAVLLLGAMAVAVTYRSVSSRFTPEQTGVQVRSLAVLPFKPLVPASRDEYFELGMADVLITRLSGLRGIVVRPTSAVVRYAGMEQDPLAAGRALKVDAVLASGVQRAGERIRVTAQLLRVADGAPLWGETFDEEWSHIFAVQDSVSKQLARALMLTLSGEERKRLTRHDTESTEAYEYYMRGRYHWNKRTEEQIRRGLAAFQQAVRLDPNYALAYTGIADSYNLLGLFDAGALAPKEAFPRARTAALRALQIDEALAEAHASLAHTRLYYEWNWSGAESEYKRAIALNPNYATAHHWYALYFAAMAQFEDALAEIERARDLDPDSLIIDQAVGRLLYLARQYDRAISHEQKTLDVDPRFVAARFRLGQAYVQKAKFAEAIAEFQEALTLSPGRARFIAALGHSYALSGRHEEARQRISELQDLSRQRYSSPSNIALIYIGLGDRDSAFKWLEKGYEERSSWLVFLKVLPEFDPLRGDPRFLDFLRRVGIG
jgi:TolB-like protein/tetratricopeptide (TPR) repeat protein